MIVFFHSYVRMIRDPELPQEEALKLASTQVLLPAREGQEVQYSWDTPVYLDHERGKNWYMIMGGVVVLLVLYGLFSNSLFMSLVVIVFAGVYMLAHTNERSNETIHVILTERGVLYGNMFYDYGEISSFYLIYGDSFLSLTLDLRRKLTPNPTIYLSGAEDIQRIRSILREKVEEITGMRESVTHRLFRILKL